MEWVLRGPQIHNTFSSLGFADGDVYHINENCNSALETILENILSEDKNLRTYRRSINFGQNITKDIIPLLINTKDEKTVELLIKILMNLTIPVECLLSLETVSQTDIGRLAIFEINNLLSTIKNALTEQGVCKVIIDFLKKNSENEQNVKLNMEQCTNISNTLLFLRNILHIPGNINTVNSTTFAQPNNTVQNRLLWNLFGQNIDKVLIKLMTIPDAINWSVTMVQLIALIYKDQHANTLHKLLNIWLDTSLSESSEDNESNTSPQNRGSNHSSPMVTSDPTSDSSDTGASGKMNENPNPDTPGWENSTGNVADGNQSVQTNTENDKTAGDTSINNKNKELNQSEENNCKNNEQPETKVETTVVTEMETKEIAKDVPKAETKKEYKDENKAQTKKGNKTIIAENSDCGYGTQIENQGTVSTSSNEDDVLSQKPVHQKPHSCKQRVNTGRSNISPLERKRKRLVKRGKTNIINVQDLTHSTPTDEEISNVLKEFTVDFLLKGYNSLVRTLHSQILTNMQLEIDTSHFFWLVTYFLKFATQIELDLEHVCSVLSFDIVSYLTSEGVNLCEQFELAIKLDGNDLKPRVRRLHLVVTAIREFIQAIEVYKKASHLCSEDRESLLKLQIKICDTNELRSLFVLLLRLYNPDYHSKQYLQDLIVTNHNLLLFLDNIMGMPEYTGRSKMVEHIRQFASPTIMSQYGLLLEDYEGNGEFVNDCIFTLMHHIGGELGCLISLFQPQILRTFTIIWKSDFEVNDEWSDLIEYVINTFIKKPHKLQKSAHLCLDREMIKNDSRLRDILLSAKGIRQKKPRQPMPPPDAPLPCVSENIDDRWTDEEITSLSWNYIKCNTSPDVIGKIVKLYNEDGIVKTRHSVVKQLYHQFIINKDEFDLLLMNENNKPSGSKTKEEKEENEEKEEDEENKEDREENEIREGEIEKLCEQLRYDGMPKFLDWVQDVLLETCFAKIYVEKSKVIMQSKEVTEPETNESELPLKQPEDMQVMSPVSYHALMLRKSVPLVPWNCQQAATCKNLNFLRLLNKLGFYMPVDTGKVFIRIPNFWTADVLYEVASKISPVDISKLKFSLNDISENSIGSLAHMSDSPLDMMPPSPTTDNHYKIHGKKHLSSMVNYTPMPGSSYCTSEDELTINKPSWLDLVQKSHEYKLNLDIAKTIIPDDDDKSIREEKPMSEGNMCEENDVCGVSDILCEDNDELPMDESSGLLEPPVSPLILPTMMPMRHVTSHFTVSRAESEYFNTKSICETASVASDLTRMYVSDEEDRFELLHPLPPCEIMDSPSDRLHPLLSAELQHPLASFQRSVPVALSERPLAPFEFLHPLLASEQSLPVVPSELPLPVAPSEKPLPVAPSEKPVPVTPSEKPLPVTPSEKPLPSKPLGHSAHPELIRSLPQCTDEAESAPKRARVE